MRTAALLAVLVTAGVAWTACLEKSPGTVGTVGTADGLSFEVLDDDDANQADTEGDVPVVVCVPACDGRTCGSDGCGGTCGTCTDPSGESCTAGSNCIAGKCVAIPATRELVRVGPVPYGRSEVHGLAIQKGTAYLASSGGLEIYELGAGSAAPTPIGWAPTANSGWGIDVVEQTAFVADKAGGLFVFDVGDPTAPVLVGSVNMYGDASAVRVSGDHAFVSAGKGGLRIFDIGDKAQPTEVASIEGLTNALAIDGQRLYVRLDDGFSIHDITVPKEPVLLGQCECQTGLADATAIAVQGDVVWIVANGKLKSVDVSDPTNPVELGAFEGDALYDPVGILLKGDHAALATRGGRIFAIDISDPTAPVSVSMLVLDASSTPFAIDRGPDGLLWAAAGFTGLLSFSKPDPFLKPVGVGTGHMSQKIALGETAVAIVSPSESSLEFVDRADPSVSMGLHSAASAYPADVASDGTLTAVIWAGEPVLRTYRMDLGTAPVGELALATDGAQVEIVDDRAWVLANGEVWPTKPRVLDVVDVLDPTNPQLLATKTFTFDIQQIAVTGSRAYLAAGDSGVYVVDLNPDGSVDITDEIQTGYAKGLAVEGQRLYVTTGTVLRVFDRSDPATPQLGVVASPSSPSSFSWASLAVHDSIVWIPVDKGVRGLDMRTPSHPRDLGSFALWDTPKDIVAPDGTSLWLATNRAHIDQMEVRCTNTPAPLAASMPPNAPPEAPMVGPASTFQGQLDDWWCQKRLKCAGHSTQFFRAEAEACHPRSPRRVAGQRWDDWVAAGQARFDPKAAEACLAGLPDNMPCQVVVDLAAPSLPQECRTALAGTLGDGQPCDNPLQCASELTCLGAGLGCGRCAPRPGLGQGCAPGRCAVGLNCLFGACVERLPVGAPCDSFHGPLCVEGAFCAGGNCKTTPVALGESCDTTVHLDPCSPNLYCGNSSQTCAVAPQAGESCSGQLVCAGASRCSNGTPDAICLKVIGPGDTCGPETLCSAGFRCQDLKCRPRSAPGDPCDADQTCVGLCNETQGLCEAAPDGALVQFSGDLDMLGPCLGRRHSASCVPYLSAGASCQSSDQCAQGVGCVEGGYGDFTCEVFCQ